LQLTVDELRRLEDDVRRRLDALVAAARLYYLISGVVAAATAVYAALATVTHCVARSRCARCCCCAANRKRKRNEQPELDLDPHTDPGIRTGTCTQSRTQTQTQTRTWTWTWKRKRNEPLTMYAERPVEQTAVTADSGLQGGDVEHHV